MLSYPGQQSFSDTTIRGFFLAQLSREERAAFESALITNYQLEQRARLLEIELIDDYAAGRLRANERSAFQQKFLVTSARQRKLEVSAALQRSLTGLSAQRTDSSRNSLFLGPRLVWRIAFSILALAILLTSVMVIRKEPQIVKRIIPKRLRPAAVVTPTPAAAHHPAKPVESPDHFDETPQLPPHEASPRTMVLPANSSPDNAPIVSLAIDASRTVRLELMLEKNESATFSAVVTTSGGELVYELPEIIAQDRDRLDLDVPVDRLKPGDFRVTLTRISGEPGLAGNYHFRAR